MPTPAFLVCVAVAGLAGAGALVGCGARGSAPRLPTDPDPAMTQPRDPAMPTTTPTPDSTLDRAAGTWPATRAGTTRDERFGKIVRDPYRWLEDASQAEGQAWMTGQNDHAPAGPARRPGPEAVARGLPGLCA